ncbi:MAG TPA: hypothetical protein PKW73_11030, partial [Candidatus Obscuribacter sp.]|nr:hypothetical protein [Candidatus Obscuribacter sp.]
MPRNLKRAGLLIACSLLCQFPILPGGFVSEAAFAKTAESTKEVENTQDLKDGVKFSYSSQAKKEFDGAVKTGRDFIDQYLKEHPDLEPGSLALVSDI